MVCVRGPERYRSVTPDSKMSFFYILLLIVFVWVRWSGILKKEIFLLYELTHPYSHVHSVLLGTIVSNSLNRMMYIIKPLGFRKKSRPIKIQNSKHLLSTKND